MKIDKEDNWEDFPEYFNAKIIWNEEKIDRFHFHANVDGKKLSLRLNDFPEEPMFTLFVDNFPVINFTERPENWKMNW